VVAAAESGAATTAVETAVVDAIPMMRADRVAARER
jgi:hypothetical protein